jgi:hypothetical protein
VIRHDLRLADGGEVHQPPCVCRCPALAEGLHRYVVFTGAADITTYDVLAGAAIYRALILAHVWSVGNLDMHPLGGDAAMITVRWIAHRPDQSVLWDFLDSYLLAIEDGSWRILGDVVHAS